MKAAIPATNEACLAWIEATVAPLPLPPGKSSRDLVRSAIRLEPAPARLPCAFRSPFGTDFFELAELERLLDCAGAASKLPGTVYTDEWGVRYRRTRFAWDEVITHPLPDLSDVDSFVLPDLAAPWRTRRLEPFVRQAQAAGKYVVGADPVLLLERACGLMGFEHAMTAPLTQTKRFESLLDRLTDLTVDCIGRLADLGGVDGFMTWQDHGLQHGPLMKPSLFRRIYKPRYARVVEAAHHAGMDFFWHTCGQVAELLPDMIEIGVDVVQLDQPRLLGHRTLAERFGGQVCFWNAVDIQWATTPGITTCDVTAEIAAMLDPFAGVGVMARHYGQPEDIGLTAEFHRASALAFLEHGSGRSMRS